jgi:hypothetical protein
MINPKPAFISFLFSFYSIFIALKLHLLSIFKVSLSSINKYDFPAISKIFFYIKTSC